MRRVFPAVLLLAAAAGTGWWLTSRPTPLERGRRLLDGGDTAGAIEVFRRALDRDPAPTDEEGLRESLSRAHLLRGAVENAEEELKRLREKFPRNAYAPLGLGFTYLARGFDRFAVDSFLAAKDAAPDDLRPALSLAAARAFREEWDEARREYLGVLERSPAEASALRGLARACRALGRHDEAAVRYREALSVLPQDAGSMHGLARTLLALGHPDEAQQVWESLPESARSAAAGRILRADVLEASGRTEDAGDALREAVEQEPRHPLALMRRARWCAKRRDFEESRALLERAAQSLPKAQAASGSFAGLSEILDSLETKAAARRLHVENELAWADLETARGTHAEAERRLLRALELSPNDVEAFRSLADLKRRQGDDEQRDRWLALALERHPAHADVLLDAAEAALAARRVPEAAEREAVSRGSAVSLPRGLRVRTEILLADRRPAEARATAAEARRLFPAHPQALLAAGLTASSPAEALAVLEQAAVADPFDARIRRTLAAFLTAADRGLAARHQLREADLLEPPPPRSVPGVRSRRP
jgi:tetratricopeptide (TPR) repeat protein